ncbi:hypothetical protein JAAARDRAFT_551511 [Jaapia argillacea MUCL 33604]|uniref:Hydrophobin n=1 Tax=Jaapia argillacea MUCL 33604 TaxID=933084 RepID=A0A067PIB2_9AGAM|nr:hypothetical protein JAAARDRAFT_551511 [Jaapia argillacea MUCL 33604]
MLFTLKSSLVGLVAAAFLCTEVGAFPIKIDGCTLDEGSTVLDCKFVPPQRRQDTSGLVAGAVSVVNGENSAAGAGALAVGFSPDGAVGAGAGRIDGVVGGVGPGGSAAGVGSVGSVHRDEENTELLSRAGGAGAEVSLGLGGGEGRRRGWDRRRW